ncbi:hypothetical protein PVK06_020834 [Gossypium arboreum]|uniref:Uncharacterized protein n=1 Tax=Gossypium arboreum TaxID=29729 RepID=A0ABR0PP38_GOSAR|nr:hypothetical protein PVK06_020834 [Gossypium arboreum]
MLEGKIDTLLEIVISQSVVVFYIDETLVNISLNFDAIIGDKSKFVTNIIEHEALMIENLSGSIIREASLDDVAVTKVNKSMATSSTPLRRRTRFMENQDLEALVGSGTKSSFKENVPLMEIVSSKVKVKKPIVTKFAIQRNKRLMERGVPSMLVDVVENPRAIKDILLAFRTKEFTGDKTIEDACFAKHRIDTMLINSSILSNVALLKLCVRELVLEFYANLLLSITDIRSKLFQKVYVRGHWYEFNPVLI